MMRVSASLVLAGTVMAQLVYAVSASATKDPSFTIPCRRLNNVPVVQLRLPGSLPLRFIIDTGAQGTVVDAETARRLAMRGETRTQAGTQGGNVAATILGRSTLFRGTSALYSGRFTAIDLSALSSGFGKKIDGIAGAELFTTYVVQLDAEPCVVRLWNRASFRYTGTGSTVSVRFIDGAPVAAARIRLEGRSASGVFIVDTGSSGSLTLSATFWKHGGLRPRNRPVIPISFGGLLPGRSSGGVARADALVIGGAVRVLAPLATLSNDTSGDQAEQRYQGLIGGAILSRYRLVIDYGAQRIYFEPGAHASAPFVFSPTGLSLRSAGLDLRSIEVRAVVPRSAAARADIEPGDELIELDGVAARALGLQAIRDRIALPAVEHVMRFARRGRLWRVTIFARPLI